MALKEYGDGGKHDFIFVTKDKEGEDWWRQADSLMECVAETRGGVPQW